jgi:alpha-tubulin suppressor-like RCC1 family protein
MKTRFKILNVLLLILLSPLFLLAQNTQLSGGNNFSVGLCGSGAIYAWGSNTSGQVGQGTLTTIQYTSPTSVLGFPAGLKFSQVNAGSGAHALALDCNKNVWSWGENQCGQTGNGGSTTNCGSATSVPQATPSKVLTGAQGDASGFLSNIIAIGGGNNFSMAIESGTGKVYAWGQNTDGELGNNSTTASSTPVVVQKCSPAGPLTNIVMIQGGDQHAYALDASGKVWAWGDNTNHNLGNGTASSSCALPVTISGGTQLKGIKMIASGDTHGLALDSSGQVWSWGGDWGPGQLGQGTTFITNAYASRVVAVNNFAATGASGPWITNAVYIAAGQASSTVVLSDGSVVSFGAYGLYPGSVCGANTVLFSGTLGNGYQAPNNSTCNSNGTRGTAYPPGATIAGYGTPEYVMTNSTTKLGSTSSIVSVARGDAWYFAIDATGATYAWGFNGASGSIASLKGGELGIGNTTDQAYAVSLTLPVGCGSISSPCPIKPALGADQTLCPSTSFTLNSAESGTGYTYAWLSSSTGAVGSYTTIAGATTGTYTATSGTSAKYYVVTVNFTGICGACTQMSDTIKISPYTSTYSATATICSNISSNIQLSGTVGSGPAKTTLKWWNDPTLSAAGNLLGKGGGPINITTGQAAANLASCGGAGSYAVWVQDTSSYPGAVMPNRPCTLPGGGTATNNNTAYTQLVVTQTMTLNSVDFVQFDNGWGLTLTGIQLGIYANTGTWYDGSVNEGAPAAAAITKIPATGQNFSISAGTTVNQTLNLGGYSLAPGTYWIRLEIGAGGSIYDFTCNQSATQASPNKLQWDTPFIDNTGNNIAKMTAGFRQGNPGSSGSVFNLQFDIGSPYPCGRYLVCASSGTCTLPVNIIAFSAQKEASSVLLEWTTASEKNSSYFQVERSDDGIHFTSIGKVSAAGNSNSIKNYSYIDNSTETSGIVYYRLQEYDTDGKSSFSRVESVSTGKARDVKIVPNPNAGKFHVILDGDPIDVHIVLLNTLGEELLQINNNSSDNSIDIQNLASGVYFLHVQTSSGSWIKKVVKQ